MQIYNSDVTDEQWDVLLPHLVKKKRRGPKSRKDLRRVVNAIFYRLRTGCQPSNLVDELPDRIPHSNTTFILEPLRIPKQLCLGAQLKSTEHGPACLCHCLLSSDNI